MYCLLWNNCTHITKIECRTKTLHCLKQLPGMSSIFTFYDFKNTDPHILFHKSKNDQSYKKRAIRITFFLFHFHWITLIINFSLYDSPRDQKAFTKCLSLILNRIKLFTGRKILTKHWTINCNIMMYGDHPSPLKCSQVSWWVHCVHRARFPFFWRLH